MSLVAVSSVGEAWNGDVPDNASGPILASRYPETEVAIVAKGKSSGEFVLCPTLSGHEKSVIGEVGDG
jgi:hypothetical protein